MAKVRFMIDLEVDVDIDESKISVKEFVEKANDLLDMDMKEPTKLCTLDGFSTKIVGHETENKEE